MFPAMAAHFSQALMLRLVSIRHLYRLFGIHRYKSRRRKAVAVNEPSSLLVKQPGEI